LDYVQAVAEAMAAKDVRGSVSQFLLGNIWQ
jgi:hypothetical protein